MSKLYKKIDLIGSGTYGKVWTTTTTMSDKIFALKEIHVTKENQIQVSTEIKLLSKCRHLNIIGYKESFVADNGLLCIIMEYADAGDLHSYIESRNGIYIDEEVILNWFVQICFALRYIHSLKILHRDMKCHNIFLTSKNVIKVGDFGIAKLLQNYNDQAQTAIGTPFYLSPEICERKSYNQKSDIWSLGCVLYEMLSLRHAFEGKNLDFLILKIMRGEYKPIPRKYSHVPHQLLTKMLSIDPKMRPRADEILKISNLQYYIKIYKSQIEKLERNQYFDLAQFDNKLEDKPKEKKVKEKIFHSEIVSRNKKLDKIESQLDRYRKFYNNDNNLKRTAFNSVENISRISDDNISRVHITVTSDPTDSMKKSETPKAKPIKWKSEERIQKCVQKSQISNSKNRTGLNVLQNLFEYSILNPEDAYTKYSELNNLLNDSIGGKRVLSLKRRLYENLREKKRVDTFLKLVQPNEIAYVPLIYHLHHLEIMCLK
ncbi:putative serine/threonine-protein kinase A [Intoshia linei]|uniref:non-specific serine/threonine protein kinase n=1 Tax=Intoshia linei TaxID=1819745 RepID=A0A177B099_9BILA|nr:putative serine/threonine-protein kinase A [Intoshia linei]